MRISATIINAFQKNKITVTTENNEKSISFPSKTEGFGSDINGGELLFLSLATCFCNDLYREASKRNMSLTSVAVTVNGKFGNEGEPASEIIYQAQVEAPNHSPEEIADLIKYTDSVAEIHATLRQGIKIILAE